jgi:hypothetical protein
MKSYRYLKLILQSRLSSTDDLVNEEQRNFEDYFGGSLASFINHWEKRQSSFQFLEANIQYSDDHRVLELLEILRMSDGIIDEISILNQERAMDGDDEIDHRYLTFATTVEELTFIEELLDEGLVTQMSKYLDQPERLILRNLFAIIHKHFSHFASEYRVHIETLEVKNSQSSWLAYPCVSYKINKWVKHLDSSYFEFNIYPHPLVDRLLDCIHQDWSKLWCVEQWDGMTSDSQGLNHVIWIEFFDVFIKKMAYQTVMSMRNQDLISDLQKCFETLIDAKRPKDQRVASFWVDPDQPTEITVIFLTRDGKLLAQRDLLWSPDNPASILEAFAEVNIRVITYPKGLERKYSEALQLLSDKYQVHAVNSVALDPVPHPQTLSKIAQKTLRIGQRFVAPLRFWARTDLVELMRCFATPQIIECLEQSDALDDLRNALQDSCSKRWLRLRKNRRKRKVTQRDNRHDDCLDPIKITDQKSDSIQTDTFNRGDELEVCVIKQTGLLVTAQVVGHHKIGKFKIHRSETIKEGQKLLVNVLGEDPKQNTLVLRRLKKSNSYDVTKREAEKADEPTLNRLNNIFANT